MVKEKLRKLRALNATREMMQKAAADNGVEVKEKGWNGKWETRKYKYKYAIYLRCQELSGYLKIAIFTTKDMKDGIDTPRFELFINPDGDEYITREFANGEEKWRKAMIENLDYPGYGWGYLYSQSQKVDWINAEGAKTIRNKLKVEKSGFYGILEYQQRVLKEKREEGYRREVAPWDADMALVPEVPDGFARWMQKKGVEEHFIFYHYDSKKEAETGYCSYCEKQVPVIKPRHNKKAKCPCCKKEITFKADGKIKRLETKYYNLNLIQKIAGGFVIRTFEVQKKYSNTTYDKPYYIVKEFRRVLYRKEGITLYCMELYKNKEYRWVRQRGYFGIGHYYYRYGSSKEGLTYPTNIGRLAKSELKHSGLPIMLKKKQRMDIEKYLYEEAGNPAIEKLVKIDMFRLAEEIMECSYDKELLNEEGTDLAKMLKLDKNRLNRLKNMDGGINHMRWLQLEKKNNTAYTDDMIRYFADADLVPKNLEFISQKMSYQKIWNYLMRQQDLTEDKPSQIVTTWQDYLNMAKKAKMSVDSEQIYKPKNLEAKHAEAIEILQQEGFKKQAEEVRKRFKDVDKICAELTKYEYESDKYCIVAPKGVEDIIREGTILQHCVHTCDFYWDRICHRETYLLFLRKTASNDVPYYTLEVEPAGNIRQKRTTGDNQNKDFEDAVGFLKKWQKEIQKRLSKEDKELGKKSSMLRKKEYEKLRKDGNKVWHGRLAGKLLVDVLEEDFMEVANG